MPVLVREVIQRGEESVVLRDVEVRHTGLEERELEVAHLLPVDDFGVQVQPKLLDQRLDVVDRNVGVPAAVDVEHERTQSEFLSR